MTLVFCMKKKLSYLTFLKVMYVKKGINFRHDINSVEINTANIYCRRCKYQLCITYNLFPLTLKVVWWNFKHEQKVRYGIKSPLIALSTSCPWNHSRCYKRSLEYSEWNMRRIFISWPNFNFAFEKAVKFIVKPNHETNSR